MIELFLSVADFTWTDILLPLKEFLGKHPLFTVGLLLIFGYMLGRLVGYIKLPEITGFIVAGLLMGDAVTGIVHHELNESLTIVTEVALGLIALTIGGEFYLAKLKRMGKDVLIITLFQIAVTFIAVTAGLFIFRMELPYALILGAIATATAPAATVAIVQSLRAHGKFVDYLYGIVALDDAGCVILFGLVFAIVTGMVSPEAAQGVIVTGAFLEVIISVGIGALSGFLIHLFTYRKRNTGEIMIITLGILFLTTAFAIVFKIPAPFHNHLSPLLTNMTAGAVLINLSARNHRIFRILEPVTPPVYALFFVLAGTHLNPVKMLSGGALILGLVYILTRAAGKYSGVVLGSAVSGAPLSVKKYLGLSMLPQAGVALGLAIHVQNSHLAIPGFGAAIENIINIILFSVFINELAGPPLSRHAVIRGNEMEE